jgi:hypothetical protein
MPPVSSDGMKLLRRTEAFTSVTAAASSTSSSSVRRARAAAGKVASWPRNDCPGVTVSKLVPSASSW